jgi:carbamoylphosphate synthase large subunit
MYTYRVRVLLSDGCGLASRQSARLLYQAGHRVGVLTSDRLCICGLTRSVQRVHIVPLAADGPDRWLDAAIEAFELGRYEILLPTQEEVAVLARYADRLADIAIPTIVPQFEALAAVFDKVTARATLERLGVPQPAADVVTDIGQIDRYPAFVKLPVATGSSGVRLISSLGELERLTESWRD